MVFTLFLTHSWNFIPVKYTPYRNIPPIEICPLYGISECTVSVCINVCLGEWITPTVTRDRPPPINGLTPTSVTNNTAVLFGGVITNGRSSNVYIINFTKTSVVSVLISII